MTPPNENITVVVLRRLKVWLWLLTAAMILVIVLGTIFFISFRSYKKDMYVWNKQMHRWAAHYYYCDSAHRDEAKCAQWSDHIPPPPPPPE